MIADSIEKTALALGELVAEVKKTKAGKAEADAMAKKLQTLTALRNAGFRTFKEIADLEFKEPVAKPETKAAPAARQLQGNR